MDLKNRDTDAMLLLGSITHGLDKSELTDEYCKKMIELYKIYIILTKTTVSKDKQNIQNLFLIKSLQLEQFRQNQIEKISHMDDNKLRLFHEKAKLALKKIIDLVSEPNESAMLSKQYDILTNVSLDVFKQAIIETYYKRFRLDENNIKAMLEMTSSLDETQIETALSVELDKELEKLDKMGLFGVKTYLPKDYLVNLEYEDFKRVLFAIERNGFSSIGLVGPFVNDMIWKMCVQYENEKMPKGSNIKNIM